MSDIATLMAGTPLVPGDPGSDPVSPVVGETESIPGGAVSRDWCSKRDRILGVPQLEPGSLVMILKECLYWLTSYPSYLSALSICLIVVSLSVHLSTLLSVSLYL